jgi:plastocyanin
VAKKNRRVAALAGVLVIASVGIVVVSGAHAQTGSGGDAFLDEPAATRTPPPPPLQIPGSWDGTIQDAGAGPGTINLTFTERNTKTKGILKGTWTVNFPDTAPEGAINDVGKLTGSVVGNSVALTLRPRKGDALGKCRIVFNAVDATQEMISGSYNFAGCGVNSGTISVQPGPPPTTVFINVADDFFYPRKVTISAGQTVRWTNNGNDDHSINANPGSSRCKPASGEAFDSAPIGKGETFDHTFNSPGTFGYHCEIHGCPMRGTITVE